MAVHLSGFIARLSTNTPVKLSLTTDQGEVQAVVQGECALAANDWVSLVGAWHQETFQADSISEVVLPMDQATLTKLLMRFGHFSQSNAARLYQHLTLTVNSVLGEAVSNFLDDLSVQHHRGTSEERRVIAERLALERTRGRVGLLNEEAMHKLLGQWYRHRATRQFQVLGIQGRIFDEIQELPSRLRTMLHTNPYLVLPLPVPLCRKLATNYGIALTAADHSQALIARTLYTKLVKADYTCMTRGALEDDHPELPRHLDGLMINYKVAVYRSNEGDQDSEPVDSEDDLIYLNEPALIDEGLTQILTGLMHLDYYLPGTASLPAPSYGFDSESEPQPVSLPTQAELRENLFYSTLVGVDLEQYASERIAEAQQLFAEGIQDRATLLYYLDSTISIEQIQAVHQSLRYGVSCITGDAGTGKCLAKDTLVLTPRGSVPVQALQAGDYVSTPHGQARILNLSRGRAPMYRVHTHSGLSFDCNDEHILVYSRNDQLYQTRARDYYQRVQNRIEQPSFAVKVDLTTQQVTYQRMWLEALDEADYYGFELEGDGLFLLGNGLLTHNTTTIRALTAILEERNEQFLICSFTGKAVARLREVTGQHALTIHSALARGELGGKDAVTIIIDEASTVKSGLALALLQDASPSRIARVIMVGDQTQLQPIGPGIMFDQVIRSGVIPVAYLTEIYRVADQDNLILKNAQRLARHLRAGSRQPFQFDQSYDFCLRACPTEDELTEKARFSYQKRLQQEVPDLAQAPLSNRALAFRRVALVAPYAKDVNQLNLMAQKYHREICQPTDRAIDCNGRAWYLGDRVMFLKNNSSTSVTIFNGDLGEIVSFNHNRGEAQVELDRAAGVISFTYQSNLGNTHTPGMYEVALGYAFTVDKSQGSEWNHVIYHCSKATRWFVHGNRSYTAITRAAQTCTILVRNLDEFSACTGLPAPYRQEGLAQRLADALPQITPLNAPDVGTVAKNDTNDDCDPCDDDAEAYAGAIDVYDYF